MPTELVVNAVHNGGMCFTASAGDHAVTLDYPLPADHRCAGMTPLQLLLSSLAVCSGSTLQLLLNRMKQPFDGLEVTARGTRREEHPTVLTAIALEFRLRGAGIDPEVVTKALAVAENQLCPVWAMLKLGTEISASFTITE